FLLGLHIYHHYNLEFLVSKRTADLQAAQKNLLAHQDQLRSLASEMSLIEERDRRQIASDLHDRIGHGLAACQMQIETLERKTLDAETSAMLQKTRNLLEQTVEDARTLSFEISPPVLYELGLEAAIEWLAEQLEKQHDLRVEIVDDGQPKTLGSDTRGVLFRAVRELLFNVVKHAKTRSAKVSISREDKFVRIDVEDDGIGFDTGKLRSDNTADKKGFGLLSIRERIEYSGGAFECRSSRNRGTRVTLTMPVDSGGDK
ncbi:MAG: sensor histidine kinase, partial [bacterium]